MSLKRHAQHIDITEGEGNGTACWFALTEVHDGVEYVAITNQHIDIKLNACVNEVHIGKSMARERKCPHEVCSSVHMQRAQVSTHAGATVQRAQVSTCRVRKCVHTMCLLSCTLKRAKQ